ncbi:unnamed protein product [Closterium sp. Naga37s-1]|nr:unnamed protein product [Closterium sp. Naga37s-1]
MARSCFSSHSCHELTHVCSTCQPTPRYPSKVCRPGVTPNLQAGLIQPVCRLNSLVKSTSSLSATRLRRSRGQSGRKAIAKSVQAAARSETVASAKRTSAAAAEPPPPAPQAAAAAATAVASARVTSAAGTLLLAASAALTAAAAAPAAALAAIQLEVSQLGALQLEALQVGHTAADTVGTAVTEAAAAAADTLAAAAPQTTAAAGAAGAAAESVMGSITAVLAGLPSMGFGIGLSPQVGIALALTLVGSLSTALGGALVVLQAVPDIKRLGLLQGFASGLMLSLTFFDLVPEAIETIGFPAANLWFFGGALLFATVVHFVPEPSLAPEPSVNPAPSSEPLLKYASGPVSEPTSKPASQRTSEPFTERQRTDQPIQPSAVAPAATAPAEATAAVPPAPPAAALAPTLTPPPPDSPPPLIRKQTLARLNSPSASSSSSFYLPSSLSSLDLTQPLGSESPDSDPNQASGLARAGQVEHPNLVRGLGSDSYRDIHVEHWLSGIKSSGWDSRDGNTGDSQVGEGRDRGVDGEGEERRRLKDVADEKEAEVGEREMQRRRQAVLWSGVITALGISLHNFPEGIAVFLGSMKGLRVGISLAVAIALHNIPEGLAVALPIYFGTRSRWAAFRAAALSGAAEPLGVVFVALFFPASLAPDIIEGLLAGGTCSALSSPLATLFITPFSTPAGLCIPMCPSPSFSIPLHPILSICTPCHPSPSLSISLHPSPFLCIPLHPSAFLCIPLNAVGGIMAFLVLHEMLPLAFEYAGHRRAVQAMFLGMAVMSANLHLLALSLPPDISL